VPTQTNATLIVFMRYARPSIFAAIGSYKHDDTNDDNKCGKAYQITWLYLTALLVMLSTVFLSVPLALWGERVRKLTPSRKYYSKLNNTVYP
jgi:hypothetical protein